MSALAQAVAVVLYLLPVAVVLTLSARRDRSLAWMAAAIPAVVAVDLLGTMLLCWAFRLELAAVISRLLWIAGGALWYDRRQRRRGLRPERPAALDRRVVAGVVVAALVGIGLSVILSRPYALWDRELHIPLVAALRGQRLPFQNSYDPGIALHYHFSGDVLAAMLQTYSFDVLMRPEAPDVERVVAVAEVRLADAEAQDARPREQHRRHAERDHVDRSPS